MEREITIQGRPITDQDVNHIRDLIASNPGWHRTRLSQELCRDWSWMAANGQFKDMAARALLRKLDARGLIALPAPVCSANNAFRHRSVVSISVDETPIRDPLCELRPIHVAPVEDKTQARLFRGLLHVHHYLSYRGPVGENVKYLVFDRHARPLGCLLFGAAAWNVASRDIFIGWDSRARERGLPLIANNMRFLLLPWVRVPHLASHVLGQIARRIRRDWEVAYGHPVALLETFVEKSRFAGTCYQAANWILVGKTTGRTRNGHNHDVTVPIKSVYLYPLTRHFRTLLSDREN